jgi:hypothetical protein
MNTIIKRDGGEHEDDSGEVTLSFSASSNLNNVNEGGGDARDHVE